MYRISQGLGRGGPPRQNVWQNLWQVVSDHGWRADRGGWRPDADSPGRRAWHEEAARTLRQNAQEHRRQAADRWGDFVTTHIFHNSWVITYKLFQFDRFVDSSCRLWPCAASAVVMCEFGAASFNNLYCTAPNYEFSNSSMRITQLSDKCQPNQHSQ